MMDRPNVVVIVADTFRRDHLGAYGNPRIRTPYLDELARSSVVFENHLLSSFPTMPARADILTGTFSYAHMGWEPLPQHLMTLPELLSSAGYLTMGVVDTPFFIRNGFGYDRGFDDFVWVRGQGDDTRPHERADARKMWRSEEDRMVARTMTEAERWLERHYDEQFFLYVDTWDPHEPWDAPPYYTELYWPGYDGEVIQPIYGHWFDAPGLTEEKVRKAQATYMGEITMVDTWVGHLLRAIDNMGLTEKTAVIFTSDHGFYFGEHGGLFGKMTYTKGPDGTLQAHRDRQATWDHSPLYEEVVALPLLIAAPGVAPGAYAGLSSAIDVTHGPQLARGADPGLGRGALAPARLTEPGRAGAHGHREHAALRQPR